jgi:hypothetical protein
MTQPNIAPSNFVPFIFHTVPTHVLGHLESYVQNGVAIVKAKELE